MKDYNLLRQLSLNKTKVWFFQTQHKMVLTLVLLIPDFYFFENSVDPDQLASDEAIWSGSTLFSTLIEKKKICLQLEFCRLTR